MKINHEDVELEDVTIDLELEDGSTVTCEVVCRFPMDDRQYIVLAPGSDNGSLEDLFMYRFEVGNDGQPILGMIETDEEYDRAADRFDELLDEEEYSEWFTDEE